ncbi:sugar-transfer associated ATP-grasp domain-containing protein [Butyrivibrio sp. AE2015]|uniref:sugar-transfer associated ATP-grasp domain-containing protein n=1 Tax=Butyrivibrio sp. AE2015 TaxID=1280663 RepID=UPI0003B315FA|nr:sugar-transfer associated ATP-grasp domain-containing protein [Butyrivibrio sp. AE2015]
MGWRRNIINELYNVEDKLDIAWKRKLQITKFKDKRRSDIFSKVVLTDEQKNEIDTIYRDNYGEKIPYVWHRHYTAFTNRFDACYFPELLYGPEFEHFMNLDKAYNRVLEDKNITPLLAKQIGVLTPSVIIQASNGIIMDGKYQQLTLPEAISILNNIGDVFCKPTILTGSGKGCRKLFIKNGVDEYSGDSIYTILNELGNDFLIQELLKCHSSIEKIYSQSVNTFRVITYRWKDNVYTTPSIMRIGSGGGYLDNAHAGGIFVAIDDNGSLHEQAFTEFREVYREHPNTNVKFINYKIPDFPKVLTIAKRVHQLMPEIGVVNWDFTINETGEPVLIEANIIDGGIWVVQMAHGCGPFGEKTPEILRWMRMMKKIKVSERRDYAFGRAFE